MLHSLFVFVAIVCVICSCATKHEQPMNDSVRPVDLTVELIPSFETVYSNLSIAVRPLRIPGWIDVDSVPREVVELTHSDASILFPNGFEIPDNVNVSAFAKHEVDSNINAIWYRMQVNNSENKDIWVVLYGDTTGPLAAHLVATKGVGNGNARIDSPSSIRQAYVESYEKTVITTKVVTIEHGRFVSSNVQTSTFGPDNMTDAKVKALKDKFFK